jgi:hypothetical protein
MSVRWYWAFLQIGSRGDQRIDRGPVDRDEIEGAAGEEVADLAGGMPQHQQARVDGALAKRVPDRVDRHV